MFLVELHPGSAFSPWSICRLAWVPFLLYASMQVKTNVCKPEFQPFCDYANSSDKNCKRIHQSGVQNLLCVYAPCRYAQQCLHPAVITQMYLKYFVKEAITAGSRPCSVYTHRAYTHNSVCTLLCLHTCIRNILWKKPSHWGLDPAVCTLIFFSVLLRNQFGFL